MKSPIWGDSQYFSSAEDFHLYSNHICSGSHDLHEFKFSASDSEICVTYDNLKFKQLLSLFWNHFGTI